MDETAWVRAVCALLQHAAALARASDFLEQVQDNALRLACKSRFDVATAATFMPVWL